MKNIILGLVVLLGAVNSCSDSAAIENELTGSWKLVETLADPGDGSGTYQPVESQKTITFNSDGTVIVLNGSFCPTGGESNPSGVGAYSIKDMMINPKDCESGIQFELKDSTLILSFPCIEPCGEKYVKVE